MADIFDEVEASSKGDIFDEVAPEKPGAISQIGTSLGNTLSGLGSLALAANPVTGGLPILPGGETPSVALLKGGLIEGPEEQRRKAVEQAKAGGSRLAATQRAIIGSIPFIGPTIEEMAYKIPDRPWEAATDVATMALPIPGMRAGSAVAEKAGIPTALKTSAAESYSRAFSPTTAKFKTLTKNVVEGRPGTATLPPVPGMIERGVTAMTRKGLQGTIASAVDDIGAKIDAVQSLIPEGTKALPANDVIAAINKGIDDRFMIDTKGGKIPASPDAEKGIAVGNKLKMMLAQASEPGPKGTNTRVIDYQILRRFKQNWDQSIAESGGFANKDFVNNAKMGAYKEAANGVRQILNDATPDIAKLNREFHFWKQAQDVIDATIERTSSQSQPMGQQVSQAAGVAAGLATGGLSRALEYGVVMRNLRKLTTSTGWNTVSAVAKDRLADALVSKSPQQANAMIIALMGAQGVAAQKQDSQSLGMPEPPR